MNKLTMAAMAAVTAIGVASGFWAGRHDQGGTVREASSGAVTSATQRATEKSAGDTGPRTVLYWFDPMKPDQHFDQPGKSPFMDMQLVPKYAEPESPAQSDANASGAAGVAVDAGMVQNLAVRLATVQRGALDQAVEAPANVAFNEREVAVVQARSAGFVERVFSRAPGDLVARGAPLVDLLLPEWSAAQSEFLALLKTGDRELAEAARSRLQLLGMSADLVARVEQSGQTQAVVTIAAPFAGVIQSLDIRAGMSIAAGATLAKINGLGTVWLEAAVPEVQTASIAVGKTIAARFAAYPGETFRGRVIAVLPENNAETRTLRVRSEFANPGGRLRPGMFAQVQLAGEAPAAALLVPAEAVIRTGRRSVVIVVREGGHFEPVEVQVGGEANGRTAILKGLVEGQKVVSSGQFLIDSEANLNGALARFGFEHETTTQNGTAAPLHEAIGKVEAVNGDEITISHGPVASLGWKPMTMPFKFARPDMGKAVKTGDTIHFRFRKSGNDYVIKKLDKVGVEK